MNFPTSGREVTEAPQGNLGPMAPHTTQNGKDVFIMAKPNTSKVEKLRKKIAELDQRMAADATTKKKLEKELEDLQGALLLDMIRTAGPNADNIAQDFAEFLREKYGDAGQSDSDAPVSSISSTTTTQTEGTTHEVC